MELKSTLGSSYPNKSTHIMSAEATISNKIKKITTNEILERFKAAEETASETIGELIDLYETLEPDSNDAAAIRQTFLSIINQAPRMLEQERPSNFLTSYITAEDFTDYEWEDPEQMVDFCETLYGFRFSSQEMADKLHNHVDILLEKALHHYEQTQEWEKLFQLLRVAPTYPFKNNVELMRLRHRANAYELDRTKRSRYYLYIYLVIQALLVVLVFPFLFIYAENGEIQRQIEATADIELGDPGYTLYDYPEALYWSLITAGSIGYGDITPLTTTGRFIAAFLGTMGVITIGVVAGLILDWITPRKLQ